MRNRQFVFTPKIKYELVAERSEAGLQNFARQTERSGGQKGRGLGGRNFCPPSLSAAAEFRASETGAPQTNISQVHLGKYQKSIRIEKARDREQEKSQTTEIPQSKSKQAISNHV
ncbi:MAG: hypothetical protein UV99_C0001G0012 [Parcubacteria group bacterium GW2011_GWC1_43_61]|nr:MAG: hypothetical protein UV99_C0001G0012 [Parcubacteria group bacterium GW2011_GWC1_43_61]